MFRSKKGGCSLVLKRISLLIFFVLIAVGCVNNKISSDSIIFVTEKSIANLVENEERLLSVEFVVANKSNEPVGPFSVEIKASNEELNGLLEQGFGNMNAQYTLQPDEKHGYGGTALVKKEISAEQLRSAIEDKNSLEVQLLDKSGEIIASEWIQKLNVVQ
jgi:hypothetical protein